MRIKVVTHRMTEINGYEKKYLSEIRFTPNTWGDKVVCWAIRLLNVRAAFSVEMKHNGTEQMSSVKTAQLPVVSIKEIKEELNGK